MKLGMEPERTKNADYNSLPLLIGGCAALLVLVGCSSTSRMAKSLADFSAATADATTSTTVALSIVQSADQDEEVLKASKGGSLKEPDIQPFFRPSDLLQRQLTLQALSTYAAGLKTLAGTDRSADIQKSFDSLKTSLDSSVTTINKLVPDSKTQIPSGVVSGLVALSSNLVIAYQAHERDTAIRTVLENSDSTVTKICRLLASELEPHGPIYDQLKGAYRAQEESVTDTFVTAIKEAAAKTPPQTLKPGDLAPQAKTFVGLTNKKEYSLALLNSLALSYRKIARAHTALKLESETGAKANLQLRALSSEIDNVKFLNSQIPK
jgi:hypothetical protein